MNILYVVSGFAPAWGLGGVARSSYEISKEMVQRGHKVTVYTTDIFDFKTRHSYFYKYWHGMHVYYFKTLSNFLAKNKFNVSLNYIYYIYKNMSTFDIVHIHEYRTINSTIAAYFAKRNGVPYIIQPRGSVPTMSKSLQKKIYDKLFGKSIIEHSVKIIATSTIESDQYSKVFPHLSKDKIVHVPNGINLDEYYPLPLKGSFKKKYSIGDDYKVILYLGRIHKRKGIDLLIEAFRELKNEYKRLKLLIVGPNDGYLYEIKMMVKKLDLEDDILLTGPLYEYEKIESYVDADVFVMPSKDKYESFGNVALEALACGTPIILTNNCGVSEWIYCDLCNVISCDKDELKLCISKILFGEKVCEDTLTSCNICDLNVFSWSSVCDRLEGVYNSII